MSILDETVPVSSPVQQLIAYIGTLAAKNGNVEAATLALELASSFTEGERLSLTTRIDHILCELYEPLRAAGDAERVANLDRLIASLKAGNHRVIVASLAFNGQSRAILDGQYERVRKMIPGPG